MAAKYRKIDPRIWKDEKFRKLTPMMQRAALYILVGQANRIGLFNFSCGLMSDDLGISPRLAKKFVKQICKAMNWQYDPDSSVLFLPKWWKYNRPDNGNVLLGCLGDLEDLPATPLLEPFLDVTRKVAETFGVTFPLTVANSGTGTGTGTGTGEGLLEVIRGTFPRAQHRNGRSEAETPAQKLARIRAEKESAG